MRAARGNTEGAAEAFRLAFAHYETRDATCTYYRTALDAAGFEAADGDEALLAALDACTATGPACRLIEE